MTKSPIDILLKSANKFIRRETTGGVVLFISVLVAIVWANSPWKEYYHHLWDTPISIGFADKGMNQPLHIWVNDGLMAIFFFVIGLGLKREFLAGELSTPKKALLPMMAAIGGMLVPALIYFTINRGLPSEHGWGIPMATDIAFALGLLSLAGKHIPASLKVFLSALAVADDLGAVLVIALFYTNNIVIEPLLFSGGLLLLLMAGNLVGIRSTIFYLIVGIAVWGSLLLSGVHATIAGVLVAFTIPARTKINEQEYIQNIRKYSETFEKAIPQNGSLTTAEQHHTIEKIKNLCTDAETPLQKIEHALHPWVIFLIMPLFALANAGMDISYNFFSLILNPVSMGIIAGLVIGKFIGVLSFTWLMIRYRIAEMPVATNWKHMTGIALLAGVGFTMSLFITTLAFRDITIIDQAKYGILLASLISGTIGIIIFKTLRPSPNTSANTKQ